MGLMPHASEFTAVLGNPKASYLKMIETLFLPEKNWSKDV